MKFSYLLLLLCLVAKTGHTQKIIEKRIAANSQKAIEIDLNIADSINIFTWNRNEFFAKGSININNNKDNERYITSFNETPGKIIVEGKIKEQYSSNDTCRCSLKTNINWNIYIPENAAIKVETINGNIIITGKTGVINAYSISGYVDLETDQRRKANFHLSTITGTVYTNLPIISEDKVKYSQTAISATYNGGGDEIKLKTISGDIYVRK